MICYVVVSITVLSNKQQLFLYMKYAPYINNVSYINAHYEYFV